MAGHESCCYSCPSLAEPETRAKPLDAQQSMHGHTGCRRQKGPDCTEAGHLCREPLSCHEMTRDSPKSRPHHPPDHGPQQPRHRPLPLAASTDCRRNSNSPAFMTKLSGCAAHHAPPAAIKKRAKATIQRYSTLIDRRWRRMRNTAFSQTSGAASRLKLPFALWQMERYRKAERIFEVA